MNLEHNLPLFLGLLDAKLSWGISQILILQMFF